ncbi:MAG TPA: L,D-transpeptidase [Longimicrobiales bacterium]|nr:L,D-transpeptidase [Longimicrobiales bacterium]
MSYPLKKAGVGAAIGLSVLLISAGLRQASPGTQPGDAYRTAPPGEPSRTYVLASDDHVVPPPAIDGPADDGTRATPAEEPPPVQPDVAGDVQERTPVVAEAPEASSRIVVSIDKRWLWYIVGPDTIISVPVAVGMNRGFEYAGRSFHFSTPRGTRRVLAKEEAPVWTVPEWHYYERGRHQGLEVVKLARDSRVDLSDGTVIVVRGDDVGRINHYGNFWPFTPGNEIIFDGKVFVPPMGTNQRRVPNALGPYKLDTGNGYLIHGTHIYNEESVGQAVSHGCVRMNNQDLERLYWMVEPGTTVVIR